MRDKKIEEKEEEQEGRACRGQASYKYTVQYIRVYIPGQCIIKASIMKGWQGVQQGVGSNRRGGREGTETYL